MTEHARTCDRPAPVVRPFVIAGKGYVLTTCRKCGAQKVERVEQTPDTGRSPATRPDKPGGHLKFTRRERTSAIPLPRGHPITRARGGHHKLRDPHSSVVGATPSVEPCAVGRGPSKVRRRRFKCPRPTWLATRTVPTSGGASKLERRQARDPRASQISLPAPQERLSAYRTSGVAACSARFLISPGLRASPQRRSPSVDAQTPPLPARNGLDLVER